MDTGALVCRSSPGELRRWRALHVGVGVPLVLVGALSVWVGLGGGLAAGEEPSSTVMVLLAYVLAGVVVAAFGLRYALLGVRGRGVVLYERIVEADFPGRWFVWPERRREVLMRVRVEGTAAETSAYAIAATGHEFPLPRDFVAKADLWRLGEIGLRPVAPGGRAAAKARSKAKGEPKERDVLVELEAADAKRAAPTTPTAPPAAAAPTSWKRAAGPREARTGPVPPISRASRGRPSPPAPPAPSAPSSPPPPPPPPSPTPAPEEDAGDLLVEISEVPEPSPAEAPPTGPAPAKREVSGGSDWEEVVPP